jgi:hypothetical protein
MMGKVPEPRMKPVLAIAVGRKLREKAETPTTGGKLRHPRLERRTTGKLRHPRLTPNDLFNI